jgi:hypothetical protein
VTELPKRILNKYLLPVHAQTGDLGVKIRKVATLKQGIIAEANAGDDVGSTECDLLYFREKFLRGTIQNQLPNFFKGNLFLRPYFGCVEDVKIEVMFLGCWNDLNAELPLRKRSAFNSLIQVFPVEI